MAFTAYEIALDQEPNYTFGTNLPGVSGSTEAAGSDFVIGIRYVERDDSWLFDLFDADDEPIVIGLKVVLLKPMLSQIVDERRPVGEFFFAEEGTTGIEAGFTDLGTRVKLYYVVADPDGETTVSET